ncbi:MAG: hypothetical protein EOP82_31535, partial [Variovorax sp.]
RFIAPAFADMGLNVALVNYPLCPSVSLSALVVAASACVPAIHHLSAEGAAEALPLVLAGHSAGAHIAVELALADEHAASNGHAIDGVVAMSGIFDLAAGGNFAQRQAATGRRKRCGVFAAASRASARCTHARRRGRRGNSGIHRSEPPPVRGLD